MNSNKQLQREEKIKIQRKKNSDKDCLNSSLLHFVGFHTYFGECKLDFIFLNKKIMQKHEELNNKYPLVV